MATGKFFPEWEKMTVREVRACLAERPSVIVPLGVTEQHGYHLPLCTDTVVATETAKRVGARAGMLVAPAINASFSGGQLPGTINVSPAVMSLVVSDVLRSLVAQGVRNIYMILGHGGSENFRALDDALKLLLRHDVAFEKVMLVFAPIWKFMPFFKEGFNQRDWHAGYVETSVVMALAPHLVQMDQLELDTPALMEQMRAHPDNYQEAYKPVDEETVIPRMAQRAEIEVGVMGTPAQASAELGRKAVEDAVERMARHFLDLEARRSEMYQRVSWTPAPIIL